MTPSRLNSVDILMITYERPEYVRRSLPQLLDSCDDDARVWLWHNGEDGETLDVARSYSQHPRVAAFEHSPRNVGLRTPTNWMWSASKADFVSKVDDDCLVDPAWLDVLRRAHSDCPDLGVVGSWRFYEEDFDETLARHKIESLPCGHRLLRNHWVQGSGYLAKRSLVERNGVLADEQSFTAWCISAARRGAINGWYFPFVHEEHMDDPRSPYTLYTDDAAFQARMPLSAKATGVRTIKEWTDQMRESARYLQQASLDFSEYEGWRRNLRSARRRIGKLVGRGRGW